MTTPPDAQPERVERRDREAAVRVMGLDVPTHDDARRAAYLAWIETGVGDELHW